MFFVLDIISVDEAVAGSLPMRNQVKLVMVLPYVV
jgi:hypothetical protein